VAAAQAEAAADDAETAAAQAETAFARAPAPVAANGDEPLLRLVGVGKNFGPVRALTDINLDVPVGQVTALVGDNGAGKSTLIKTIAGIWTQDHGEILWEGKPVRLHSPKDAADLGIATVYQDLALADNLDIVQNMFLGREPVRHWVLDETRMEKEAKRTLADLSVVTVRSVRQPVGSLSGGQRQAVAVARAVLRQARLVILDEPTAALGVTQTRVVLDLIRRHRHFAQPERRPVRGRPGGGAPPGRDGLGRAAGPVRQPVDRRPDDHGHLPAPRRRPGRAARRAALRAATRELQ
jgi:ABC-type cobalamin/Fe3+-siderophores transport system ATPase subunit